MMQRRTRMPTVGLVGVGLIGRAWANVFSRAGWDVRIWDPVAAALAAAPGLIAQSLEDVARHGFAKDPAAAAASAILASSSFSIDATATTEKLKGRHRCLVAHPVNPPHVVPIVELSG